MAASQYFDASDIAVELSVIVELVPVVEWLTVVGAVL